MSVEPPGGYGTIHLTGWAGQAVCAPTGQAATAIPAISASAMRFIFVSFLAAGLAVGIVYGYSSPGEHIDH